MSDKQKIIVVDNDGLAISADVIRQLEKAIIPVEKNDRLEMFHYCHTCITDHKNNFISLYVEYVGDLNSDNIYLHLTVL